MKSTDTYSSFVDWTVAESRDLSVYWFQPPADGRGLDRAAVMEKKNDILRRNNYIREPTKEETAKLRREIIEQIAGEENWDKCHPRLNILGNGLKYVTFHKQNGEPIERPEKYGGIDVPDVFTMSSMISESDRYEMMRTKGCTTDPEVLRGLDIGDGFKLKVEVFGSCHIEKEIDVPGAKIYVGYRIDPNKMSLDFSYSAIICGKIERSVHSDAFEEPLDTGTDTIPLICRGVILSHNYGGEDRKAIITEGHNVNELLDLELFGSSVSRVSFAFGNNGELLQMENYSPSGTCRNLPFRRGKSGYYGFQGKRIYKPGEIDYIGEKPSDPKKREIAGYPHNPILNWFGEDILRQKTITERTLNLRKSLNRLSQSASSENPSINPMELLVFE